MRKRARLKPLQPIGDILLTVLKKRGMAAKLEENALCKFWPRAVGAQIASQTQPDALRAGTLFVRTTSSIWVQQLHFLKEDIRGKLNGLAGTTAVKDIIFTVGHIPAPLAARTQTLAEARTFLKERDRKMIDLSTRDLADRELADILKRVMEKEISRRRRMENGQAR
jgi:predicted nucleic acid-binding Zn ribbon protein